MKHSVKKISPYVFVQSLGRLLRHVARLVRWSAQSLNSNWQEESQSAKRLLIIYDFASQPFSIGDILMFQEASLVLRERYAIDRVDFAMTYDPANPVVPDPAFSAIGPANFLSHLPTALQAAQVNPHLGSLFLFDSHNNLEDFASRNLARYMIWPPLSRYLKHEYLYYHIFNEILFPHFHEFGTVPALTSRSYARDWAEKFIRDNVKSDVAVTVQLRRNYANPARNSDYEAWHTFLKQSENRYPVKFIVICNRDEMDPMFGDLSNAIFAKDHFTGVEQDLALIEVASMHIGASSGPGVMAIFSSKPYCFFNSGMLLDRYKGLIQEGNVSRLFFASPQQRFVQERESADSLMFEFNRMWSSLLKRDPEEVTPEDMVS